MITLLRTDASNPDFLSLVEILDAELAYLDGDDHAFYSKLNKVDDIRHAVVAYDGTRPVACGAIRDHGAGTMEVKRMFVQPEIRKTGLATIVLRELEKWAVEMSIERCVLETGKRQPEAIALYKKNGYRIIPNYGKYVGVENSVCFEKTLK